MTPSLDLLYIPVAAYLIGGIPFGFLVGRWRGIDIRTAGSGNIGATNVGRLLGRRLGITVFLLDFFKGLLPTWWAGSMWCQSPDATAWEFAAWLGVAACTVMGHICPPYLRFRGGKGVATSLGATVGVHPYLTWPALLSLCVWVAVISMTRIMSIASLVAAVVFPVAVIGLWQTMDFNVHWPMVVYAMGLPALVLYRHRSNIRRLIDGTEPRLW